MNLSGSCVIGDGFDKFSNGLEFSDGFESAVAIGQGGL